MSRGAPVRTNPTSTPGTIMDRSVAGRRSFTFADLDVPEAQVPEEFARSKQPVMPEVSELELVRHYTQLSQTNYGIDIGFYPLGSCTMKYNPKASEEVAALPGFRTLHPLAPDSVAQGALELMWNLEQALCEITGMARATLQPPAGACGELTGLLIMKAYHQERGSARTKVLIPDSAHGTNPASVRLSGFDAVPVPSDATGKVDVAALAELVDDQVAGLMLTNPNTLGIFEEDIVQIAEIIHDAGGLLYYDGANLNAILGHCRPGDMGFDIVHMNTHKTFATPHGGGGPGAGPVGVIEKLIPYLPVPTVERDSESGEFNLCYDSPRSIGRMHGYHGNFGVLVRAFAYITLHGGDGLKTVSEMAALNANYLAHLLKDDLPLAHPEAQPMHEFVATATSLREETGIRAMDVAKRLIDLGYHPPTVYFPLVVDEAMMMEPTETETKETLEDFAAAMKMAIKEARENPDLLKEAPVTAPVRRLDEARAARQLVVRWRS